MYYEFNTLNLAILLSILTYYAKPSKGEGERSAASVEFMNHTCPCQANRGKKEWLCDFLA
jgi:hypothetical protein